jgi:hypothetical protein
MKEKEKKMIFKGHLKNKFSKKDMKIGIYSIQMMFNGIIKKSIVIKKN